MIANLRFALRTLCKSPGFTVIALLTLALGIGVNTSMFSVVDTLIFRAAPYPESERLIFLMRETRAGVARDFSATEFHEIHAQANGFSALTAHGFSPASWTEPGRPAERITGLFLSGDMMGVYQTQPLIGRPFAEEEYQPGKNQVVLLSHSFWQARFAGDPEVVGRTMRLDGETVTIVGVMPQQFDYKLLWGPIAFVRPLNFTPDQIANRNYRNFLLVGRLKSDANPAGIVDQLSPLAASLEKEFPQDYSGLRFQTMPFHSSSMDSVGRSISWTLLGLSGFVLLIACGNLANLQLARATSSLRDFAVRAALGASRGRLILQQLTESVIISLAGGALGLLVAMWINSVLERTILIGGESSLKIEMDLRVLAVTFVVATLSGVIFGLMPALFASRADVGAALKSQSRTTTGSRGPQRVRHALIVGEVALALVLLGGAAIMNRGFQRLLNQPAGWDIDRILAAGFPIPEARFNTPEKRAELYSKIEERLAMLPGVERAAIATATPIYGYHSDRQIFSDPTRAGNPDNPSAFHVMISPNYFAALGIPLREGKTFAPNLKNDGPQYVIINESLARRFWPNESAVGKRIGVVAEKETVWREIVGVAADVNSVTSITNPMTQFTVYKPFAQEPWSFANLIVRSSNPAQLTDTIRRAVAEIEPDLPIDQIGTVRQAAQQNQHNLIVIARLMIGFAALGLLLAAVGLYGVISHIVAQRTAEFGIRLALGAQPRDILRLVLSRGLWLTSVGLIIGFLGSWALGHFLASFMPRVVSADPLGHAVVAALLVAVTFIACWLPARRATQVDPMTALRAE